MSYAVIFGVLYVLIGRVVRKSRREKEHCFNYLGVNAAKNLDKSAPLRVRRSNLFFAKWRLRGKRTDKADVSYRRA